MKRSTTTMLAHVALAVMVTAIVHVSTKGPPSPGPYAVTSTVPNTDAFGNATLVQSDDSVTGSPVYSGTDSPGVISQIDTGAADWNFDLRCSSRGFLLTLVTPAGDNVAGMPSGPTYYNGRVISRCFTPSGGTTTYSWFAITDNPNCAMRVNFTWNTTSYTLVMSPLDIYAGTGLASVHCNAFVGSSCVDWTVTPDRRTVSSFVTVLS